MVSLFCFTLSVLLWQVHAATTPSPPALPLAFNATLQAGKFKGFISYDYTKLSYFTNVTRHVFGSDVFNTELFRYDVTPPVQFTQTTFQNCTKSKPEIPACIYLSILPGSQFMGWQSDGTALWQHKNFLDIVVSWNIQNSTNAGKTSWVLRHFNVHVPILGNTIQWTFSNIQVGLQDVSHFQPWTGCVPVVPPKTYHVAGYVRNAVDNSVLPGLEVTLTHASGSVTNVSDSNGIYHFDRTVGGETNITVGPNAHFLNSTITLNVTSDIGAGGQADIFVSPALAANKMRLVLTWGYMPQDLDSHMWDGNCEIAFYNLQCPDGNLDHDTTTGYGPETITMTLYNEETPSQYHYFVHQYSSQGSLQTSSARVVAYVGNAKVLDLAVPTDSGSSSDTYWDVGYIDPSTGQFTKIVNQIVSQKPTQ